MSAFFVGAIITRSLLSNAMAFAFAALSLSAAFTALVAAAFFAFAAFFAAARSRADGATVLEAVGMGRVEVTAVAGLVAFADFDFPCEVSGFPPAFSVAVRLRLLRRIVDVRERVLVMRRVLHRVLVGRKRDSNLKFVE